MSEKQQASELAESVSHMEKREVSSAEQLGPESTNVPLPPSLFFPTNEPASLNVPFKLFAG